MPGVRQESFTRTARRAQIVTVAIEVIAEVGYQQASLRRIADRVGIAMSAVLYHFGTKDNLVDAIVEHMYRAMVAVVAPAVAAETTAADRLAAYIRSTVGYYATHRSSLLALTSTATGFHATDGRPFTELGMRPDIADQLAQLDPAVILTAGQDAAEFGSFPVDSTALALRGAVNAVVERVIADPAYDAHRYGEELVEIFGRVVGLSP